MILVGYESRKMMKIHIAPVHLVSLCLSVAVAAGQNFNLASPDGSVQILLSQDGSGHLQYSVSYRQKPVIEKLH